MKTKTGSPAASVFRYRDISKLSDQGDSLCTLEGIPSHYTHLTLNIRNNILFYWKEFSSYLLSGQGLFVILFCHSDGSKTLLVRIERDVFITCLRSALSDRRYLRVLADFIGIGPDRLENDFKRIPTFSARSVSPILLKLEQAKQSASTKAAVKQLQTLLRWYDSKEVPHPYAFDIRVFAVLQALRDMMINVRAHLLVISKRSGSMKAREDDLARLYTYRTDEPIPQRPPIFAATPTKAMRDAMRQARNLDGKKIGDGQSLVGVAVRRSKWFKSAKNIHVFFFSQSEGMQDTMLEVFGEEASPENVDIVRRAVEAALDPTDVRALQLLAEISGMNTWREARDFRQLLLIYSRGLISAYGADEPEDEWQRSMLKLRDETALVHPGTLSSRSIMRLEETITTFQTGGDRRQFKRESFDKALASFGESLRSDRGIIEK